MGLTANSVSNAARDALRQARVQPTGRNWRSMMARSGLVAKGMLYTVIGLLSIQVASGAAPSNEASTRGAVEFVYAQPFGRVLLIVMTIGLIALAAWQFILAVTGDTVEGDSPKDRAKFAVKGIIYGGTSATAMAFLTPGFVGNGVSGAGSEESQERTAAMILNWPGGPWIVALVGGATIAFGVYQLYTHAWHREFMGRLRVHHMSAHVRALVERAGRLGYTARAIVLALVGGFLVVAAVQHDPSEAVGLSGALRAMSREPWGEWLLWVVAVGLFMYGCFCFAEARFRRAT